MQQENLKLDSLMYSKKLEVEETTLRLVQEILGFGMWTIEFDENEEISNVFWSDDFRKMLGYIDEIDFPNCLESWSNLIHKKDKEAVLASFFEIIHNKMSQEIYDVKYRLLTQKQGYRWFRTTGKVLRTETGKPIHCMGIFMDITIWVKQDLELKRQRKLLEATLKKVELSNQAKTNFLNNMSHDILTPMNAIVGFATLASSHMDDKALVQDYLSKILASSNQLLTLINDVLEMSQFESGKVSLEEKEENLRKMMNEIESMIQSDIASKQLNFHMEMSLIVHENILCDKRRLNQVLLNIISNAIKFTPTGGTIDFQIQEIESKQPCECASFIFRIKDTGMGMSKAFIQRIFEPFERERTSTISGIKGTGLGLTIVKKIVDMMQGKIQVESEVHQGTEFILTISFKIVPQKLKNSKEQLEPLWKKQPQCFQDKYILLVEDNELNREIAMTILEEAGFQVDLAEDGLIAVEKVKKSSQKPYDLILMDIQMPNMDGYEATKEIRRINDPRLSKLPILALTANTFFEDQGHSLASGMNGFLNKPLVIEELFEKIEEIFQGK